MQSTGLRCTNSWLTLAGVCSVLAGCAEHSSIDPIDFAKEIPPDELTTAPSEKAVSNDGEAGVNDAEVEQSNVPTTSSADEPTAVECGVDACSSSADGLLVDVVIEVCPAGTFVDVDELTRKTCKMCERGTFSSGFNWSKCIAWSQCGWGIVATEGTSTKDRACASSKNVVQFGSREVDEVWDVLGAQEGVYVAGYVGANFPGYDRLIKTGSRYVAKVSPTGKLEWVHYIGESPSFDGWFSATFRTALTRADKGIVAVWAESDTFGARVNLVVTELALSGEQLSEARVPLEIEQSLFSPELVVHEAVALEVDQFLVVGTLRESSWGVCGKSWVIRMRANGEVIWTDFLSAERCLAWEAAFARDGVVYLGGNVHEDGVQYGIIYALTFDGLFAGQREFDATAGALEGLVVDEDGNLVVAFSDGVDAHVHKWTPLGTEVWSKTLRGAYLPPHLALGRDSSVWIAGGTDLVLTESGYDGLTPHPGSVDVYVGNLSKTGETVQFFQFGSRGNDVASSISIFQDKVYVAGETDGVMGIPVGEADGFVIQLHTGDGE